MQGETAEHGQITLPDAVEVVDCCWPLSGNGNAHLAATVLTAGKTAPTDNQLADIQAFSTHAPASNRRQAGFPWVTSDIGTRAVSEPSRFRGADITGRMSTGADPKTASFSPRFPRRVYKAANIPSCNAGAIRYAGSNPAGIAELSSTCCVTVPRHVRGFFFSGVKNE